MAIKGGWQYLVGRRIEAVVVNVARGESSTLAQIHLVLDGEVHLEIFSHTGVICGTKRVYPGDLPEVLIYRCVGADAQVFGERRVVPREAGSRCSPHPWFGEDVQVQIQDGLDGLMAQPPVMGALHEPNDDVAGRGRVRIQWRSHECQRPQSWRQVGADHLHQLEQVYRSAGVLDLGSLVEEDRPIGAMSG